MREMKDSGIEWISKIPKGWDVSRLKDLFTFGKGLPITKENLIESGIPVISYGQIHAKDNPCTKVVDSLIRYVSPEYLKTNRSALLNENDILMADTSEDLDGCGNCVYINRKDKIFAGYHTIKLVPVYNHHNNKYLSYLFQTDAWRSQIRTRVSGVKVFSITQRILKLLTVICPPDKEQKAIVDFLDCKCAEIDAITADIESQIEKLEQYKRSIITEAVTKGLNPNAEMKDSGIEWVGKIPTSWNIHPVYYYFGERKNRNRRGLETNLLSLSYGNIIRKDINTNEGLLPESFNTYNIVEPGDIIIRSTDLQNDKRSLRTGLVKEHGIITSAYIALKAIRPLNPAYFHYLLHAFDVMKVFYNMGNGVRQGLNYSEFSKMMVIEPPIAEQNAIVEYLNDKCSEINSMIADSKKELDMLSEYKKSLIYEYVTGKKEVSAS